MHSETNSPAALSGNLADRAIEAVGAAAAWSMLRPPRVPSLVLPSFLGLPVRRFALRGREVDLAAWHVPCPGSKAGLVLCHGHAASRGQFTRLLRPLHEAGFHLLLFDHRSMGVSPGICSYGFNERWDTLAAVDWLRREAGVERVGLYGVSMGGATALLAAAQDPEVRAVATDCAFARLDEMVERKLLIVPPGVRERVGASVRRWAERWTGAAVASVDPEQALREWEQRPLLVIQAEGDLLVPPEHGPRLAAAAGEGAELWMVPGAWHARCHLWAGPEYPARLTAFFRENLGA
jgi:pimeloyl-ACP methyl ester carboxylesterase